MNLSQNQDAPSPDLPDPYPTWSKWQFFGFAFLVMVVWPLAGAIACYPFFDHPSEMILLFGGVSSILILPVYFFHEISQAVFGGLVVIIWVLTWFLPCCWLVRRSYDRRLRNAFLFKLSMVSLCQALIGALMILGKNV